MTLQDELEAFVRKYAPRFAQGSFAVDLRSLMNGYAHAAIEHGDVPKIGVPHRRTDAERLDILEIAIRDEPIVLHALAPGNLNGHYHGLGCNQRTLREAIDQFERGSRATKEANS